MELRLRPGIPTDAQACGQISFSAFARIAQLHGFPCDVASAEETSDQFSAWISDPGRWVLVAESAGDVVGSPGHVVGSPGHVVGSPGHVVGSPGHVVGSIVLDERGPIVGLGPITVDPQAQDQRVGHQLMTAALEHCSGALGVRLVQATYHNRSLALYSRIGFDVREPLVCLNGRMSPVELPDRHVRAATTADLGAASLLCQSVHGHDREGELRQATAAGTATVVIRDGRLTGYATQIGFAGHAVAATDDDLLALIAAAPEISGQGFLLPSRNNPMLRRCLALGLRIQQPLTLMTLGYYQQPVGAYLPSISY